jgi:hypothetical protein
MDHFTSQHVLGISVMDIKFFMESLMHVHAVDTRPFLPSPSSPHQKAWVRG